MRTDNKTKDSHLRSAETVTCTKNDSPTGARKGRILMTLIAALLVCPMGMSAQDLEIRYDGDWSYTVAAGVVTLKGYNGTDAVITTPTELGGYPVRYISNKCFNSNSTLTNVTVSEGIVSIGEEAFFNHSNLVSASLPNSLVSLGKRAFYWCEKLTTVELPNTLTRIEEEVFYNCSHLKNITLPSTLVSIGKKAFYSCPIFPNTHIPSSVRLIEEGAFGNNWYLILYYDGTKSQWDKVTIEINELDNIFTCWQCTATFNANGHGTDPASQMVYRTETVTAPTAPTAQGYDFGGWYTEATCTSAFDFNTVLEDNITLYAKWTALENTITFNTGGRGSAISQQAVYSGNTVTLPDIQFDGNDGIEGWYTDEGRTQPYDFTTAVDHSFTLYAKWAAAGMATITAGNGGTVTLTDGRGQTFNEGKVMPGVYTLTVTPASGYSYNGSYTRTERSSSIAFQPTSISGSSTRSYELDLTAFNADISLTFSTQPILTVSKRADDESVLNQVIWSVVNNQTSAQITDGGAIPYISDPNGMVASDFGIHLNVDLGSLSGYAFTATISDRGAGSTVYKNSNDGTSLLIKPYGSIDIDLYIYEPQSIVLEDDGSNIGTIQSLHGDVASVTLKRAFTTGKKQTVCMPFAPEALLSRGTVWEFTGISEGKVVMTERTSGLKANTPYIFEPTAAIDAATGIEFGTVSINYGSDPKTRKSSANFTFHGTYAQKTWEADDAAVTGGTIYGFMMKDNGEQLVGQFVKARRRTVLRPYSCWLEYTGDGELTGTQSAPMRAGNRAQGDALPDVIEIMWVGADGSATTTGMMDITTGQIYEDDAWYSIDGRKIDGKPAAAGLYIHNGKTVYYTAE